MRWLGNYAAYSSKVLNVFFEEISGAKPGLTVFDPMCGTGSLLIEGRKRGIVVDGYDINQIQVIQCRAKLLNLRNGDFDEYYKDIQAVQCEELQELIVSNDWYSDRVVSVLIDFRGRLISHSMNFSPDYYHLAEAAFVLALRNNSCYGLSSNPTWLKRGGTLTGTRIREEYLRAIRFIQQWHNKNYFNGFKINSIVDVKNVFLDPSDCKYDICITSPPYCNRLDYRRMFGPEHFFYSHFINCEEEPKFMGDNTVKGYVVDESLHNQYELDILEKIKVNKDIKNNDYYYRYYSKYFNELREMLTTLEKKVNKNGYLLINVQNSTCKDIEICIDDIIISNLGSDRAVCIYDEKKNHFGNIVKAKTKQKETIIKIRC